MGLFSKKTSQQEPEAKAKVAVNSKPVVQAKPTRVEADPVKAEALKHKMKAKAHRVLVRPLVTEKTANLAVVNQYAFEVKPNVNKITIAEVISALYGVNVLKVRTMIVRGKSVRYGRTQGQRKIWKKALVTLKAGEKIDTFAGI